jgi:hypothetical protein
VNPDPDWIRIQRLCGSGSVLGIRIPDPDPGARNFSGKMHFIVIFNKTTFWRKKLMNYTRIFDLSWLKFWFQKNLREIVFKSSVLAWIRIRNRLRIRIEQKCWIRVRNKSIRIHNPENKYGRVVRSGFVRLRNFITDSELQNGSDPELGPGRETQFYTSVSNSARHWKGLWT